jgi:hypothetical protein
MGSATDAEIDERKVAYVALGAVLNPREMPGRYASVMRFPDRTCIQLKFVDPTSTGGEPIYCYRSGTLQLTEEHSNVE